MNFDKSRVYTVLNAEELKLGSKVIVVDNLLELKECVVKHKLPKIIEKVELEDCAHRFLCDDGFHYALAYLVKEPKEKQLEWNDLKVGDVITNGTRLAMVVEIDKECVEDLPIFAGHMWLSCSELTKWIKVKE